MNGEKPKKLHRVKWAVHRTMTEATTSKMGAARWVLYGSAVITSTILFAADGPNWPKWPRYLGD